ncbi:MAG: hypothetical protein CK431_08700 [Mycobacterium sp.]|nr:MAG: hypothetical protein CK431_08700 [Mycobacterium sp.]
MSPDAGRPMPSDNLRAADPPGAQQEPTSEPSPRRPDADVARGGDDLPPPGPGPIDPTGFDNPANHRNYGPNELAPLEDPIHQAALEQALRGPDGDYRVGADPRMNAYGDLVNDGGPTVDGRANNCLDCALAGLASFYGDPTVSVPRFLDQRPDGTIDLISGEASGLDRARGWLGDDLHLSDQNLSVREQYAALHREITLSGPGSSALVVSEWHARDAAGNLLYHPDGTPVLDGSHATVVVYPHDGAGPVWWDPQNSLTSDHPPAMLVSESAYLWSTPIPADHFGPTPDQGGRHGAAGDRGTSTGLPGSDLPRPHLPGDPVRDGLGRFTDPGGGQHRGAADRAGEAGDRLGDRDRHHAPQPADQRSGPNLHDGKAFRAADGKPDLPAPMADHPAAHPGGSRDHRLPDDGGLPGTAARTHGGAQPDHQQADLHSRTEGRPVEGGDVSRPLAESAEPGSVARGSDGDALAGDTAASEPDAGDRGRTVASHLDAEHALALANEALWKRIPPVHPDEIRHHLADSTFGEQRAGDNATWWRGLTGEEQRALIDSYAREIGNAEGVPAWARTEANEHRLSRLHDELQARREAGEHLSRREVKELRRYEQLRSTLDKARAELAGRGGEVHILAFDPHAFGGDGRIVVSVGHEPHHAESVSWHVPGITTTINSLDINLTNALNHLESTRREDPHLTAASIAWIGYDAPSGLGLIRTPFRGLARAGGAILHGDIAAFNSAVDVIAGRRNDNHIFGHSYGSTTTSFAGRDGGLAGHVRSVTLLGSPGAAGQHRAADFNIGDRVFVASSSRDPVTAAGARAPVWRGRVRGIGLGIDPAMHSFGAQRITAEFPHHMDNWDTKGTHTAYYAFDTRLGVRTESLANFGRIAAGHFDEVQLDQHRTARRWWSAGKLTDEPVVGRPLRLEPTNGEPYSVKRRFWDPDWHSGHAENHVDSQQHLIAGDGVQPRGHDVHEGRCAHDVSDFLSERYGRDVDLRTGSTAAGVPARNLFEAWGSASKFANYNEIHDALIRHGDGSAALLTSQWAGGPEQGGHAYVAVNDGGAVYLVDRFELSGWPPSWGPDAVHRTAVGYFDRHGNPIEPLSGRPGQLAVADSIGHVAGAGPAPGDDGPAAVTPQRDYDASGHTIPTDRLVHPQAELLDLSLLDSAAANPHRVSDALAPGVPSTHPEVQHMVPDSYDPLAGIGEKAWNDRYWPTGNRDAHGNPELVWPDPGMHPQGFATPESRTPVVLNPGQFFDRFGPGFGVFGSPAGTSFPERALPPHSLDAGFHRYEVLRPVPVWEGPIAPAMGQPGGGVQYYFPRSIVDLVNAGYLREIPL